MVIVERAYLRQLNDLGPAKSHLPAPSAEGHPTQDHSVVISAMPRARDAVGAMQTGSGKTFANRSSGPSSRRSGSSRRTVEKNAPRPDIQGERKPGPDAASAGLARMLGNIGAVKLPASA